MSVQAFQNIVIRSVWHIGDLALQFELTKFAILLHFQTFATYVRPALEYQYGRLLTLRIIEGKSENRKVLERLE